MNDGGSMGWVEGGGKGRKGGLENLNIFRYIFREYNRVIKIVIV